MIVTDTKIIKSATPKYPEIVSQDAEKILKEMFNKIQEKESKLSKLRMEVIALEKEIRVIEDTYIDVARLFDITFGKKEIKQINNNFNLGIINPSDYRNTNI